MKNLTTEEITAMRDQAMRDGAPTFWAVVDQVSAELGVDRREITSRTRGPDRVSLARAWVCRCAFDRGISMSAIARFLGRDHTSVMSAIERTRAVEPVLMFRTCRAIDKAPD
jgi:chromosomal replication initiation ATPase DnaA